jgi:hypothetical protein
MVLCPACTKNAKGRAPDGVLLSWGRGVCNSCHAIGKVVDTGKLLIEGDLPPAKLPEWFLESYELWKTEPPIGLINLTDLIGRKFNVGGEGLPFWKLHVLFGKGGTPEEAFAAMSEEILKEKEDTSCLTQ